MWLTSAIAATLSVSPEYPLDQALLDADDGDVIEVTEPSTWTVSPAAEVTITGVPAGTDVRLGLNLTLSRSITITDVHLEGANFKLTFNSSSTAVLTNVDITNGDVQADGPLTLTNGSFTDSDVLLVKDVLVVDGTRFSENSGLKGGGIWCRPSSSCRVSNATFEAMDNDYGAGIYAEGIGLLVENSTFCGLLSTESGSAIWATTRDLTVVSNRFIDLEANFAGAIDLYVTGTNPSNVDGNTFVSVSATAGPGVGLTFGPTTFRNNLMVSVTGNGKVVNGGNGEADNNLYYDVAGTTERPGPDDIVGLDPLLIDPSLVCAQTDLRIRPHSPAAGAGHPFVGPNIGAGEILDLDVDLDGLLDSEEMVLGTDPDAADTDRGGVTDGEEVSRGTDPLDPYDDLLVPTETTPPDTTPPTTPDPSTTTTTTTTTPPARNRGDDPRDLAAAALACGCASPGGALGTSGWLLPLLLWRLRRRAS